MFQGFVEARHIDRLGHQAIHAGLPIGLDLVTHRIGRKRDDGRAGTTREAFLLANSARRFQPVQPGPRTDAFAAPLVTEGPIARTTEDLTLLVSVQSGYDQSAPISLDTEMLPREATLNVSMAGRRIGWMRDLDGRLPFEPGIIALCEAAPATFESAGVAVEPVRSSFDWGRCWRSFETLRQQGLGAQFRPAFDPARRQPMKPKLQWEIAGARQLSADDVAQALLDRTAVYDHLRAIFERFDFLALPM